MKEKNEGRARGYTKEKDQSFTGWWSVAQASRAVKQTTNGTGLLSWV